MSARDAEAGGLQSLGEPRVNCMRFYRSPELLKVINNSGWMMFEQICKMVVALFVSIWIARQLGPKDYGVLIYAVTYISIFTVIVSLGINRVLIRELSSQSNTRSKSEAIIATAMLMRLIAAGFVIALSIVVAFYFEQGEILVIAIISAGMIFNAFDCIDLYFQSRLESRKVVIARTLSFCGMTVVKILLLLFDANVYFFALASFGDVMFSALSLYVLTKLNSFEINLMLARWDIAIDLIKECWTEILAGLASIIYMKADQIIVGNILGADQLGVYAVAAKLAETWYFIPAAIVASTFPGIVKLKEKSIYEYERRISQLMVFLVGISYLTALATYIFADSFINGFYGAEYQAAADILLINIWCGLFVGLGLASGSWLVAEKKLKSNLYRNIFGAITNIVLGAYLVKTIGVKGAAYGALISILCAFFIFDFMSRDMRKIGFMKLKALLLMRI